MARDKARKPPFDREEIEQEALSLLARYGTKKKAERAAMARQAGRFVYWLAVADAIRRMK
jgi:hypothetical protein